MEVFKVLSGCRLYCDCFTCPLDDCRLPDQECMKGSQNALGDLMSKKREIAFTRVLSGVSRWRMGEAEYDYHQSLVQSAFNKGEALPMYQAHPNPRIHESWNWVEKRLKKRVLEEVT